MFVWILVDSSCLLLGPRSGQKTATDAAVAEVEEAPTVTARQWNPLSSILSKLHAALRCAASKHSVAALRGRRLPVPDFSSSKGFSVFWSKLSQVYFKWKRSLSEPKLTQICQWSFILKVRLIRGTFFKKLELIKNVDKSHIISSIRCRKCLYLKLTLIYNSCWNFIFIWIPTENMSPFCIPVVFLQNGIIGRITRAAPNNVKIYTFYKRFIWNLNV